MGLKDSAVTEAMKRRYGDGGEGNRESREREEERRGRGRLRWKENRGDGESTDGKMEIRKKQR